MTVIQIVRKLLTPDEVSNPNQRYNADCDCVQTSYDGGTTWTDTPNADPRHYDGFRLAPVTGDDPQCLAAGNMTDKLKFILDTIIAGSTIFAVATAVVNIVLVFAPAEGILLDLILAVAQALFDLGLAAVDAALTTGVYDQLACILYCSISGDGQVSAAQYAIIRAKVDAEIGGLAAIAIDYALDQLGEVGLSNAGTMGQSTRDCTGCSCEWCYDFVDATGLGSAWSNYSGGGGTYNGTTHRWEGTVIGSGSYGTVYAVDIKILFTATSIDDIKVRFGTSYNDGGRPTVILYLSGSQVGRIDSLDAAGSTATNQFNDFPFGGITCDEIRVFMAGGITPVDVNEILATGTGDNPFGSDNC